MAVASSSTSSTPTAPRAEVKEGDSAGETMTPIQRLGEHVLPAVSGVGDMTLFFASTLWWLLRRPPRWQVIIPSFYSIGVSSVPVVALTGTFIGMVLAIQTFNQFAAMHMETKL